MKFLTGFFIAVMMVFSFDASSAVRIYGPDNSNKGAFSQIQCGGNVACKDDGEQIDFLRVISVTADDTLTQEECGAVFIATADTSIYLPEASANQGCQFKFLNAQSGTSRVDVHPSALAERILVMTSSDGNYLRSDSFGDTLTVMAISQDQWAVIATSSTDSVGAGGAWLERVPSDSK